MAEVTIHYAGPLVTREEAKSQKLTRYFTGIACSNGHIEQRLTCNGKCFTCSRRGYKRTKPPIDFHNRAFNFQDLTEKRFGRLTVIRPHHKTYYGSTYWTCVCDCGTQKEIKGESLRSGAVVSCGCFLRETARTTFTTHGLSNTRAHKIWRHMRSRCSKPKNPAYRHYGGRGISVCERWDKFENFLEDMGTPPDGFSIERIDNSKSYSPDNCKWGDWFEQANNTRKNVFIEYKGEKKTIAQWAKQLNIHHATLTGRYNSGWSPEDIISVPVKPHHKRNIAGWPTTGTVN